MKRVTRSNSRSKEIPGHPESDEREGEMKKSSKSKETAATKKVEKIVEESDEIDENLGSEVVAGTSEVKTGKKTAGKKKAVDEKVKSSGDLDAHVLEAKKPSAGVSGSRKRPAITKKTKPADDEVDSEENEEEPPKKSKSSVMARKVTGADKKAESENDDMEDDDGEEEPPKKSTSVATKKAVRGKKAKSEDDDDMEDNDEEEEPPKKSTSAATKKAVRGKKAKSEDDDESEDETPSPSDKADSGKSKKNAAKPSQVLTNKTDTNYDNVQFESNENFNFKIVTWNVAGLRALAKKNKDYIEKEDPDIICLNEIKCALEEDIPDEFHPEDYHAFWNIGKGFGGVGILSKIEPISVTNDLPDSEFSDEKRIITAEFEKFYLVSVYVVNAGRGLKTLEKRLAFNEVFDEYVKKLDKKKPVIIAGDMNVSHQEIDLANPKTNKKNAGFTQEERDGFTKLLSYGFIDTFRDLYPDQTGAYTFWSYLNSARAKNVGWRLDYFLVSKRFKKHVKDSVIRSEVLGSDHCPIVLLLSI